VKQLKARFFVGKTLVRGCLVRKKDWRFESLSFKFQSLMFGEKFRERNLIPGGIKFPP